VRSTRKRETMNKADFEDRQRLEAHLEGQAGAQNWPRPWEARDYASRLVRDAGIIKRAEEVFCSIEMDERTTKALERKMELAEARIHKVAKTLGITATTGGDCRGCCAYLHFTYLGEAQKPHNSWGGAESGWGL